MGASDRNGRRLEGRAAPVICVVALNERRAENGEPGTDEILKLGDFRVVVQLICRISLGPVENTTRATASTNLAARE